MGPQAASELEPAGAWKGFYLPGATGCWEGSATASSARGGQQLVAAGLEPACPAWAASAPLGWEWPCGRMASPWQGVLSPWVGACPQAPCLWGKISSALLRCVVFKQLCASARRKLGQLHFWVLSQRIGVELACLSAGKAG